ncbi:hypothetical protein AVDCRST_MAG81-973, partial [uncultured Synechococcales cyanobacterium]
ACRTLLVYPKLTCSSGVLSCPRLFFTGCFSGSQPASSV